MPTYKYTFIYIILIVVVAACYVDPTKQMTMNDLERFFKCVGHTINSCEILRLVKTLSDDPDQRVTFPQFLRFPEYQANIFQELRDLRETFQQKIFKYEVYVNIKHRRKNINKIKIYYEDNGKFPPQTCNQMIRKMILHTTPPFKYDYTVESGNYAGTIGRLISKYTEKYKPQSVRLKELKGLKVTPAAEAAVEKAPGAEEKKAEEDEEDVLSPKEGSNSANENNEMGEVREKIRRFSERMSLKETPGTISLVKEDNLTPRSKRALAVGIPKSFRSFAQESQEGSIELQGAVDVSNDYQSNSERAGKTNVLVINVEPKGTFHPND